VWLDGEEDKTLIEDLLSHATEPLPFEIGQHVVALWSLDDDERANRNDGSLPQGDKTSYPAVVHKCNKKDCSYDMWYLDDRQARKSVPRENIFNVLESRVSGEYVRIPGMLAVSGVYSVESEERNWLADRRTIFVDFQSGQAYCEFTSSLSDKPRDLLVYNKEGESEGCWEKKDRCNIMLDDDPLAGFVFDQERDKWIKEEKRENKKRSSVDDLEGPVRTRQKKQKGVVTERSSSQEPKKGVAKLKSLYTRMKDMEDKMSEMKEDIEQKMSEMKESIDQMKESIHALEGRGV